MQVFPKLHSNPCDCLLITFVIQLLIAVNMTILQGVVTFIRPVEPSMTVIKIESSDQEAI